MKLKLWLKWLVWESITDELVVADLKQSVPVISTTDDVWLRRFRFSDYNDVAISFGNVVADRFLERADQGDIGSLCFHKGKAVAYCWATRNNRSEEGFAPFLYEIRPGQEMGYLYDAKVLPEHRGKDFGFLAIAKVFAELRLEGCQIIYYTHQSGYTPMQRISERLGFKCMGKLHYKRFLMFRWRNLRPLEKLQTLSPASFFSLSHATEA